MLGEGLTFAGQMGLIESGGTSAVLITAGEIIDITSTFGNIAVDIYDKKYYSALGRGVLALGTIGYDNAVKKAIPHPKDLYEKTGKKVAYFLEHLIKNIFKFNNENK